MKTKHLIQLVIIASATALHAETIALFNTGVDGSHSQLPGSATDPHWRIVSGPGISAPVPAIVIADQSRYQYAQSSDSRWVWLNPEGVATFNSPYTVRLEFDLTGLDPTTAIITGRWAADNDGYIRLNGSTNNIGTGAVSLLGHLFSNLAEFHQFTLTNGFIAGTNILEFVVTDYEVGGGLNVSGLTGSADLPTLQLFNSGVDGRHTPLPGSAADSHWRIMSGPGISAPVPAIVLDYQYGYGYCQSPDSGWVWANSSGVAGFNSAYTFRQEFDLTGLDPRTAIITGRWAVDNVGYIRLNGSTNNIGTGAVFLQEKLMSNFESCHDFQLTNGFVAGLNTLEFVVTDNEVGGGLNVSGLTGTARAVPPIALTIRMSQVELCWQAATNFHYQVQYRSSLTGAGWISLGDPIAGDGRRNCLTGAIVEGEPQRFYQILTLP